AGAGAVGGGAGGATGVAVATGWGAGGGGAACVRGSTRPVAIEARTAPATVAAPTCQPLIDEPNGRSWTVTALALALAIDPVFHSSPTCAGSALMTAPSS